MQSHARHTFQHCCDKTLQSPESVTPLGVKCCLGRAPGCSQTHNRHEPDSFKNVDTQLGVHQDRVGPAPTVFGPKTNTLLPQAEKPVASLMKKVFPFIVNFSY